VCIAGESGGTGLEAHELLAKENARRALVEGQGDWNELAQGVVFLLIQRKRKHDVAVVGRTSRLQCVISRELDLLVGS